MAELSDEQLAERERRAAENKAAALAKKRKDQLVCYWSVAHFYGMSWAEVEALTLEQMDAAIEFMSQYAEAQNKGK